MQFNYKKMSYEPEDILTLAENEDISEETRKWARRELQLNGYCDISDADAGEPPKERV